MVPRLSGGLAVSLVGVINGAINATVPRSAAPRATLGIGSPV